MNRCRIAAALLLWATLSAFSQVAHHKALRFVETNETKPEYLGKSHLTQAEKDAVTKLVFQEVGLAECVAVGRLLQEEIDTIRVARARLGPAPEHNLLVQASDNCLCGGTGNCEFWAVRQKGTRLEVLLETFMVQTFSVKNTRTNGYRDIQTSAHGSATSSEFTLYKFNGKRYKAAQCWDRVYKLPEDGGNGKKPTITAVACSRR